MSIDWRMRVLEIVGNLIGVKFIMAEGTGHGWIIRFEFQVNKDKRSIT